MKQDNADLRSRVRNIEEQQSQIAALQLTLQETQDSIKQVQIDAADEAEVASKKLNLRVTNLPEVSSKADADRVVPKLLSSLEVDTEPTDITYYKTSSASVVSGRSRTSSGAVVVRLPSAQAKAAVFKRLSKLRNTDFHYSHVDDDLTKRQNEVRKSKQAKFKQLKDEGKRPH